jgi:hypothetical protein
MCKVNEYQMNSYNTDMTYNDFDYEILNKQESSTSSSFVGMQQPERVISVVPRWNSTRNQQCIHANCTEKEKNVLMTKNEVKIFDKLKKLYNVPKKYDVIVCNPKTIVHGFYIRK